MKYRYFFYLVSFVVYSISMSCYAGPFKIKPLGSLPTGVEKGSSVNASYTVTNNSRITRVNNFVRWFPPNVTQVTDPTDPTVCSKKFTLGPKKSINQSCILKLKISGPVNRNDPNSRNHLIICFPGGLVCSGPTPENSLNVKQLVTKLSTSVGVYKATTNTLPIAYTSNNNGATWFSSILPTRGLPQPQEAILFGVGCQGKLCSAVGFYGSNNRNIFPLTYSSSNRGVTWSLPRPLSLRGIPVDASDFTVSTPVISCSGSSCSTVGGYQSKGSSPHPLSYYSSNNGVTWSQPYKPSTTNLPDGYKGAALESVSCTGSICNAVGAYNNDNNFSEQYPLTYHSIDNGATWPKLVIPSTEGFPTRYLFAQLLSVSCSGDDCTALGRLRDLSVNKYIPFTYLSSDGGLSWDKAHFIQITGLSGSQNIRMNSISCVGAKCVIVGTYSDTLGQNAAYYTSIDYGATWLGPFLMPTRGIPLNSNSNLNSVSCINNICSAVGEYENGGLSFPLTYRSINNGRTWTIFLPSTSSIPNVQAVGLFGVGGSQSGILIDF